MLPKNEMTEDRADAVACSMISGDARALMPAARQSELKIDKAAESVALIGAEADATNHRDVSLLETKFNRAM